MPEYEAVWRPSVSGQLLLRVDEPSLADLDLAQGLEVVRPDDELRHPALAKETGGRVVRLKELDQLAFLVPNRAQRTPNDIREPLWSSYVSLIAVLVLLTAEWVGRKVIRLV